MMLWIKDKTMPGSPHCGSVWPATVCHILRVVPPTGTRPIMTNSHKANVRIPPLIHSYLATRLPFLFRYFRKDFLRMIEAVPET